MGGSDRVQRALPLSVLIIVAVLDVALGPERVVLTLVVIAPLVAATASGRRATLAYGVLALVVGALLGVYDDQYTGSQLAAQVIRLCGIAEVAGQQPDARDLGRILDDAADKAAHPLPARVLAA